MGDRKKLLVQQLGLPLISLRVPKHSVASRMHGLTAIDLINRRDTAPIDFPSSSLIAINRDSRTRTFHRGRAEFPENVRNSLHDKGVGSPGRIRTSNISVNSREPVFNHNLPEPRQIEGNQQVLIKWDKADSPSLFSF